MIVLFLELHQLLGLVADQVVGPAVMVDRLAGVVTEVTAVHQHLL